MTTPSLRKAFPLITALTLAAGVASAAATPLGTWMKANMGTAMASQDFPTLKTNFDLVASKPPPSGDYGQWASSRRLAAPPRRSPTPPP